jgi:hypothetical protein
VGGGAAPTNLGRDDGLAVVCQRMARETTRGKTKQGSVAANGTGKRLVREQGGVSTPATDGSQATQAFSSARVCAPHQTNKNRGELLPELLPEVPAPAPMEDDMSRAESLAGVEKE